MKLFILGAVAFDEISHFPGRFSDVIKADQINTLSVSFRVEEKESFYGGCAGNIAYSLGLLGSSAYICSNIGEDGAKYKSDLHDWGMNTDFLLLKDGHTAEAYITSDIDQNQIAHFAAGVINDEADDFLLPDIAQQGDLLLVSPEAKHRMMQAVEQGHDRGMKIFFDPGQVIHSFNQAEMDKILSICDGLFVNEYEWEFLKKICRSTDSEIAQKVDLIFLTRGKEDVMIYENTELKSLAVKKINNFIDPTGAGDAFRAGVLASFLKGLDTITAAKVGIIMGASCVQFKECQGHTLNADLKHELETLGFA